MGRHSTTGIKYLNIDYQKKYKHTYIVRVVLFGKHFIVWSGDDIEIGRKVAEKVNELMSIGHSTFIDWYDNDMERWMIENGYKDANK